jgi:hypothetical protein
MVCHQGSPFRAADDHIIRDLLVSIRGLVVRVVHGCRFAWRLRNQQWASFRRIGREPEYRHHLYMIGVWRGLRNNLASAAPHRHSRPRRAAHEQSLSAWPRRVSSLCAPHCVPPVSLPTPKRKNSQQATEPYPNRGCWSAGVAPILGMLARSRSRYRALLRRE